MLSPKTKVNFLNPQAGIEAPETDKSFGPEGRELDLCGRMLREAPVSTKKCLPEAI